MAMLGGILIFAVLSTAIPCDRIGSRFGENGGQPGLDPFRSGQGFDIIPVQHCFIRFQNPKSRGGDGTTPWNSRVTRTAFVTTPDSMYESIKSYHGDMLWLPGNPDAFQYAGLLRRSPFDTQVGLSAPDTMVSFMLPSGTAKLHMVSSANQLDGDVQRATKAGIFGVNGRIDISDYAYSPLVFVANALVRRYGSDLVKPVDPNFQKWFPNAAYVLAEKEARDQCVVIDFRGLDSYMAANQQEFCGGPPNQPPKNTGPQGPDFWI